MITLAAAKAHCRVDHDDEDELIYDLVAAASDHLAAIGVDMEADPLPQSVVQAVLILTAHLYDHRDDTDAGPQGLVDRLVAPFREVSL